MLINVSDEIKNIIGSNFFEDDTQILILQELKNILRSEESSSVSLNSLEIKMKNILSSIIKKKNILINITHPFNYTRLGIETKIKKDSGLILTSTLVSYFISAFYRNDDDKKVVLSVPDLNVHSIPGLNAYFEKYNHLRVYK